MDMAAMTKSNDKGEILIPKNFRDYLGINTRVVLSLIIHGRGLYIYPIEKKVGNNNNLYLKILEKTKGSWSEDNKGKERRKIELLGSLRRKLAW